MISIMSIRQFCEKHPAFTEGGLRYLIFNAADRLNSCGEKISGNGLQHSGAILRVGRRVLIDEGAFFEWVRSGGAKTMYDRAGPSPDSD